MRGTWITGALFGVVAMCLHLVQAAIAGPLWRDESFSAAVATEPWNLAWQSLWGSEANMALYYVLLHGWLALTAFLGLPTSPLVIRAPSTVFAGLSVALLFLLGQRLFNAFAAALAAGLFGLNFLQLDVAGQARSYGLELALLIGCWYALLAALTTHTHRRLWWGLYVVATALAVYSHLFSVLVIAAQVVAVILAWRLSVLTGRSSGEFAIALGLTACLIVPMALDVAFHGQTNVWVTPATLPAAFHLAGWLTAGIAPLALCLPVTWALGLVHTARDSKLEFLALIAWIAVPVVVSFFLTQPYLNLHLFLARYLVVIVPALALLAGAGVSSLQAPRLRLAAAVMLFALSLPAIPKSIHTTELRDASAIVEIHTRTSAVIRLNSLQTSGLASESTQVGQGIGLP